MVLNLVGGTELHKFRTCIHRTLRNWKNKMCFFFQIQNVYITIYCISAQTVPCIICTQKQKHNEYLLQINVTFAVASQRQFLKCVASPWQVPLSYHFRNKVRSFSLFLCLPSSKRTDHKDML